MIKLAKKAAENAFVPYNKHKMGSSILAYDGSMFTGCNVENSISGLGNCSEICAIDNAVSHGKYKFRALCVFDTRGNFSYPCGVCRQYIAQFIQVVQEDIKIIVACSKGHEVVNFKEIFPKGYYNSTNLEDIKEYADRNK